MFELIATVVAGAVGIVGIWATYRAGEKARMSQMENLERAIAAESDRARRTEKRRIYAGYIAAAGTYVAREHSVALEVKNGCSQDRAAILRSNLEEAMTAMLNTLGEIRLIASRDLAVLAVDATRRILASDDLSRDFPDIRDGLFRAMRSDLGEPAQRRINVPELVANAAKPRAS